MEVQGHAMFRLVKKLKAPKRFLNKLNWKNRNLFDRVKDLRSKLHTVQEKIDSNPSNTMPREEGSAILREYNEALQDEENLLRQKTKVTWLKEGDKNSAYFYKVLKVRLNRSRIMAVCAKDGKRYIKK